ncbi:MAG: polysaccharide pyruvyl transferase family protein [Planctomycetota bacterium]
MSETSQRLVDSVPQRVLDVLGEHRGRRALYEPLSGNHGDHLIRLGAEEAMRRAGVNFSVDEPNPEVVIVTGGAGMTDIWKIGLERLGELSRAFPEAPLIVMPQTFNYADKAWVGGMLSDRRTPATLFARDVKSQELLESTPWGDAEVRIERDHDMAFTLDDSEWMARQRAACQSKHLLVVERTDAEQASSVGESIRAIGPSWTRVIPAALKMPAKRWIARRRAAETNPSGELAVWSQRVMPGRHPECAGQPMVALDVSHPAYLTFDQFTKLICEASVIVTTRMHVGIFGALLGKPVYLRDAKFGKIRGVYEQSMADTAHVALIDPEAMAAMTDQVDGTGGTGAEDEALAAS